MLRNLALVMGGGAVGSGARYLVAVFCEKQLPATFPGAPHRELVGSVLLGAILATAS